MSNRAVSRKVSYRLDHIIAVPGGRVKGGPDIGQKINRSLTASVYILSIVLMPLLYSAVEPHDCEYALFSCVRVLRSKCVFPNAAHNSRRLYLTDTLNSP